MLTYKFNPVLPDIAGKLDRDLDLTLILTFVKADSRSNAENGSPSAIAYISFEGQIFAVLLQLK